MATKAQEDGKIREYIFNGIFYPDDENELTSVIQTLIKSSKAPKGESLAIISPHAGYTIAGNLIASAFKSAMKRNIKTVVIIAPIHNDPPNEVVLPESKYFLTPLGSIKVNHDYIDELSSCSNAIICNDIPHLEEHCIEIQLPFIKYLFPKADIVPILLGNPTMKNIKLLSNALQLTFKALYPTTLFVISANMTSFLNSEEAKKEFDVLLNLITEKNWQGIPEAYSRKKISSCGSGCIATVLSFNNIDFDIKILENGSSDQFDKDIDKIVMYSAISMIQKEQ
ncbi:MAG: AmmeMemoRadiSam system protein B [Spirochaetales bacterium]|nr:AmmeMemoRadiSam system protein B [Spirochaetales bacterium]